MGLVNEQLRFEVPAVKLAHTDDPPTARDAAERNRIGKATHRRACLAMHAQFATTGLIDDEVSSLTGLSIIEARRRCTDLRNSGLIKFTPHTRTSDMGRAATISMITPAGREALA